MAQNKTQKFIVPNIGILPTRVTIQGQDAKHIYKVLRLSPNDPISITNGQGKDYSAQIVSVSINKVEVDLFSAIDSMTESPLQITLCSGMLKDKKMDFIIKHATQLGICKWIPFFCERSIPFPNPKRMEKRYLRWQTIAKESLKQCRRSQIPQIFEPISFKQLLDYSDNYKQKIAFWEKASSSLDTLKDQPYTKKVIILIGPEGGFSQLEIKQCKEKDFSSYLLGPRILRAETASICACTLIQHILGDI